MVFIFPTGHNPGGAVSRVDAAVECILQYSGLAVLRRSQI